MGDTAYILHPEYCDLCKSKGLQVEAVYDGKTIHGPWAYMCEEHFGAMGVGLGTGRGQRLIVGEKPDTKKSSPNHITEVDDEEDTDETLEHSVEDVNTTQNAEVEAETVTPEHAQSSDEDSSKEMPVEEKKEEKKEEKPASKRKRLRASRRKQSIEQLMADSDMKRLEAEKTVKPEQSLAVEETPEEEQVPYVMKMDWGNIYP